MDFAAVEVDIGHVERDRRSDTDAGAEQESEQHLIAHLDLARRRIKGIQQALALLVGERTWRRYRTPRALHEAGWITGGAKPAATVKAKKAHSELRRALAEVARLGAVSGRRQAASDVRNCARISWLTKLTSALLPSATSQPDVGVAGGPSDRVLAATAAAQGATVQQGLGGVSRARSDWHLRVDRRPQPAFVAPGVDRRAGDRPVAECLLDQTQIPRPG